MFFVVRLLCLATRLIGTVGEILEANCLAQSPSVNKLPLNRQS